jgi:hypothetical protein
MTRFTGFLWLNPAEGAEQFCAPDGASRNLETGASSSKKSSVLLLRIVFFE